MALREKFWRGPRPNQGQYGRRSASGGSCGARKILALLFLVVVIVRTDYAAAGKPGATGQEYREWSKEMRVGFVSGFYAGYIYGRSVRQDEFVQILFARSLWATLKDDVYAEDKAMACLNPMSVGQMVAVLDRYVATHPEVWDKAISTLALDALNEACSKRMPNEPAKP